MGAVHLEVYQDILNSEVHVVLWSPTQTYVDTTVDVCKWFLDRSFGYLLMAFKSYIEKNYNPKLLKCPLKKGSYVVAKVRDYIRDPTDYVPPIIPMVGNITLTGMARTHVDGQVIVLGNITEVYEFY